MGELHLLCLLAYHHQQHHAEQNTGRDQHFSIGKTLLKNKSKDRYHPGKNQSEQCTFQHHAATQAKMIALQKEDDLEPLAIKRRESEQDQSPP